jgi:hypothetical protein
MALTLSSTTPSTGATDYYINKQITLQFSTAIDSAYLTDSIVSLFNVNTNEYVPVALSLNPVDSTEIIISPEMVLDENTNYRVRILGEDSPLGLALQDTSGDKLAETTTITFSTGDNVYDIDADVEKQAASVTLEGDLFLPNNLEALGYEFTIESVTPENHSHGVSTSLNGSNKIEIKFSKPLATGQTNYIDWASVSTFPILAEYYMASGTTFNEDSGNITIPDYNITVSGEYMYINFDSELPKNVGITAELNSNILSQAGDQYGGNLYYAVNTETYPSLVPIQIVRNEVRPINVDFFDDYIGTLIYKNTISLMEMGLLNGNQHSITRFNYILYSTVIDLIEDKDLQKFVVAGTRRQLGDLNTSVDNLAGRLALKLARSEKLKESALDTMKPGWQIRTGSYTLYENTKMSRLWYDISGRYTHTYYKYKQLDQPAANTAINRHAKTNNPWI